ncbi:hypothetical protein MUK42_03001 [Musa troglodytarum]|uniref:Uncharacterized protein n=1 Tax=Musa troglodytarum TaxID=320322 RepID=A0A9E7EP39_9LILI|nr:hypothetical protein MUK42_02638 [Musa troglodytarum]URD80621.1 hypothetical protein MUK42_03001 [Musa troglodytarum]
MMRRMMARRRNGISIHMMDVQQPFCFRIRCVEFSMVGKLMHQICLLHTVGVKSLFTLKSQRTHLFILHSSDAHSSMNHDVPAPVMLTRLLITNRCLKPRDTEWNLLPWMSEACNSCCSCWFWYKVLTEKTPLSKEQVLCSMMRPPSFMLFQLPVFQPGILGGRAMEVERVVLGVDIALQFNQRSGFELIVMEVA